MLYGPTSLPHPTYLMSNFSFPQPISQSKDTGIMFNRAKALGIIGQLKEADEAYKEAAHSSHGRDLQVT